VRVRRVAASAGHKHLQRIAHIGSAASAAPAAEVRHFTAGTLTRTHSRASISASTLAVAASAALTIGPAPTEAHPVFRHQVLHGLLCLRPILIIRRRLHLLPELLHLLTVFLAQIGKAPATATRTATFASGTSLTPSLLRLTGLHASRSALLAAAVPPA